MRRFDREMRTFSPNKLEWFVKSATEVLANSDVDGRPTRLYTGETDGVVTLAPWHLADAVSVFKLPKAQWHEPVTFVLTEQRMTFVVEHDGSVSWSSAPAKANPGMEVAYALPYGHAKHAALNWQEGAYEKATAPLRLSAEDALLELTTPPSSKRLLVGGTYRITPEVTQPDLSNVWAQQHDPGVPVHPEELSEALSFLLSATAHAGRDYARSLRERKLVSEGRKQDHGAIWFCDGEGHVRLRTGHHRVTGENLAGLRFGIGRKDAEALVHALRLMTLGRRRKAAVKAGWSITAPHWSRWNGLNVITNGDVGFAFPEPKSLPASPPKMDGFQTTKSAAFDYTDLTDKFPRMGILNTAMTDVVRLGRWDEAGAFVAKTRRGSGRLVAELANTADPVEGEPESVEPIDDPDFNLEDLTKFFDAVQTKLADPRKIRSPVTIDLLVNTTRGTGALTCSQALEHLMVTSLFGAIVQPPPKLKIPVTLRLK
ncbi:MAG: hypothetical protein WA047_07720 [Phenylobacterium sp.]|uniref:hypothetical protein n=1 Tax=Phenylobacterium sp. TaxID=1871053 RepID=UPI003BB7462F